MLNLIFFGAPGAGKGTQAEKIAESKQLVHISTGDLFRFHLKNNTDLGNLAKTYMDKGELVPDDVTINMLKAKVDEHPDAKGLIFDGFPRTTPQARALDDMLTESGHSISKVIAIDVDDELLVERLLLRGKESQRADDQDEAIIRNRLAEYYSKTDPLRDYYKNQNKLVAIDGVGAIQSITQRINENL